MPVSYTHLDVYKRQALEGYEELKLESITSETTAAEWEEKAKTAAQIVADTEAEASVSGEIINGQGKVCLLYTSRCV